MKMQCGTTYYSHESCPDYGVSSSPRKGKGKEKPDLNGKWREVKYELDGFPRLSRMVRRREKQ